QKPQCQTAAFTVKDARDAAERAAPGQSAPHCPVFEMAAKLTAASFEPMVIRKEARAGGCEDGCLAALLNSASAPPPPAARFAAGSKSFSFLAALPLRQLPASQQQQKGLPSASELATKNPVSIINELRPNGVTFHLVDTKEAPGRTPEIRYAMRCRWLRFIRQRRLGLALPSAGRHPDEQSFADSVCSACVRDQFEQLASGLSERLARRKVLAGIVMSRGPDLDPSADLTRVRVVTTGPSASPASTWTPAVSCLLDCHAEVLSRRCLLQFFHHQLATAIKSNSESIFQLATNGSNFERRAPVRAQASSAAEGTFPGFAAPWVAARRDGILPANACYNVLLGQVPPGAFSRLKAACLALLSRVYFASIRIGLVVNGRTAGRALMAAAACSAPGLPGPSRLCLGAHERDPRQGPRTAPDCC
uniref:A to I editase domain-containing protein n=1 Tax=Macrostomum lignano TaxID=282301 RepID=A0A1I8F5B0_9PLAT